ncbi:MAG: hypothetical protein JO125_16960 [Chloroflexi bacterium]|nr:hypothetical protein [Chloroflexota bacterium]
MEEQYEPDEGDEPITISLTLTKRQLGYLSYGVSILLCRRDMGERFLRQVADLQYKLTHLEHVHDCGF